MANMKEEYGALIDIDDIPTTIDISYYLYKDMGLPTMDEAVDHFNEGENVIRQYLENCKINEIYPDPKYLKKIFDDWFHLPVHCIIPILIDIIIT